MENMIICGDSLDVLPGFPSDCFNLVVADPEYFSTANDVCKRMSVLDENDYLAFTDKWIIQIARILKDTGSFYGFFGDIVWRVKPIIERYLTFKGCISWIKRNRIVTTPQLRNWFPKCELVLFFVKSENYVWNKPVRKYGVMESSNFQVVSNIYRNMKEGVDGEPAQKPKKLIEKFVYTSSDVGDWVLDPFCGSGTVPVVCSNLSRRCCGIDISMEKCRLARGRLLSEMK